MSHLDSAGYRFGQRRTRELLAAIDGLREDQIDAIASDMALEWDRVLDGLADAMVGALLERRLTAREARRRVASLLGR
jgi:hypothetical protein